MSWRWRIEPGCEASVAAHLRPLLERGEPPAGAVLVKRSVARDTWRAEVPGLGPVYVKRDRTRGLLERLKFLVLPSRAAATTVGDGAGFYDAAGESSRSAARPAPTSVTTATT